jgi:DNA-binding winged helix-turn-helix (wHTH) protein
MDLPSTRTAAVKFGLFEADFRRRLLLKNGLRVRLQDQPFELLRLLLERPGEIVTREEIRQKLWSADTFVEFDDGLNTAIKKLRAAVGDSADNPRFIETVPRHGYRFVAPVTFASQVAPDGMLPLAQCTTKSATTSGVAKSARPFGVAVVAALAIAAGTYLPRHVRKAHALSNKDGIVLADFSNSTGDAVFDDALRQGLAADLAQTPFLSLL